MFESSAIPKDQRADFDREIRARMARGVWAVSLIAFFLFPVTTILDRVTYPEVFGELSLIRFSTSAVGFAFVGLLWWMRRSDLAVRYARASAWGFILICCVGLDGLILMAGGPESPYYAGLTLLLLAVLVAMPFGVREMALVVIFIMLQFNLFMIIFDDLTDWLLYVNANYFFASTIAIGLFGTWASHRLRIQEFLARASIEAEKARSEALLLNILPEEVADELKARGRVEARKIKHCTILFSDFVGFTSLSERADPAALVRSLDQAFSRFDSIMTKWGLEKLKTIGDAYMCAGGVLVDQPDHLVACILAGMEMLDALDDDGVTAPDGSRWKMRLGVHSGPVVAGVIGSKKFAYDLWGDTVNTASRLESSGQPGSVNVMTEVFEGVARFFEGADRGFVTVRGKGPVAMTQVRRLRPEFSADARGRKPNDAFYAALDEWVADQSGDSWTRTVTPQPPAEADTALYDPLRTFSVLTHEDRESLMKIARRVPMRAGQALIEEGQGLSVLFLVLEGLCGVRMERDGVDIQVAVIGPGEIVGELSFVSLEPASATVVGLSDGAVLRFDLDELQALTGDMPGTGARLFHSLALVLARRVREANARLFTVVTPQARLEQSEAVPVPDGVQQAIAALREAADRAAGIGPALDQLVREFGDFAASHGPGDARFVGATVLRDTYSLLMRSPLLASCHRHVDGCVSDHTAMDAIASGASEQSDPVARALDEWFLQQAPAGALRDGFDAVTTQLKNRAARTEGPWCVADLVAGAAPAVFSALVQGEASITCVDRDLDDLAFLGARARDLELGDRLTLIRADVLLPARLRGRLRLVPQDFAFITALTQPLDDEQFVALLDEVHRLLVPGGRFIVGQLDIDPYLARFLDSVLGWQVRTRDNAALVRCAHSSRFGQGEVIHSGRWHGLELIR